ncbi:YwqJ-related putative deaminase [Nocardia sp. NPDC004722]
MFDTYPATSSSLLVHGKIFSHTSLFGEGLPNHHPVVQDFIEALPAARLKRFAGNCAELALVSDQLWGLDAQRVEGGHASLDEARDYLKGAVIVSKKIRPHDDPEHGQVADPCQVCRELLDSLGIRVLVD